MTGDVPAPTVPDLDAIRGRYRAADFATDEPWAAALNDVVLSSWLDVPALLAEVERLRAQREAVVHVSRVKGEQDHEDMFGAGWDSAMASIRRALGVTEP